MVDGSHKKRQKLKQTETTKGDDDLPFTLISSEILSKLPAKSDIGRCRCVSKQWNSFLSTPTFTRTHLRRHVSINDYKLLLFDPQSPLPFCRLPFNQTLPNPNPNPNPGVLCIVASLDGLVCLGSREPPATLMFWNPFTGAYKKLSSIPCMFTPKFFFTRDPIGFYKDSSNDYKLVCLINPGWAHVYSNRLDSWKKIEFSVFYSNHRWIWSSQGTFCAQCVYFTVATFFDESLNSARNRLIICFDVETETFRKIRFPSVGVPDGAVIDYHCGGLVVLNGCLHLSVSYRMFNRNLKHVDLWRMDDGDEWVKVAAFSDVGAQQRRVCTASNGNWLAVLDEDDNSFRKMNTEDFTTHYRYFCSASRECRSSRIVYAETLVSP